MKWGMSWWVINDELGYMPLSAVDLWNNYDLTISGTFQQNCQHWLQYMFIQLKSADPQCLWCYVNFLKLQTGALLHTCSLLEFKSEDHNIAMMAWSVFVLILLDARWIYKVLVSSKLYRAVDCCDALMVLLFASL